MLCVSTITLPFDEENEDIEAFHSSSASAADTARSKSYDWGVMLVLDPGFTLQDALCSYSVLVSKYCFLLIQAHFAAVLMLTSTPYKQYQSRKHDYFLSLGSMASWFIRGMRTKLRLGSFGALAYTPSSSVIFHGWLTSVRECLQPRCCCARSTKEQH
jgi:hypothetical protein